MTARPRPTVANLLRYDRILTELWTQNGALLPVRFGTVLAERILVLNEGVIVEEGSHEELLARRGVYFTLAALQPLP